MKPNFYTILVLSIVLPVTTVHAQMNNGLKAKSSTSFSNTKKQSTTGDAMSSDWYDAAVKNIQQLEGYIKPAQTAGSFTAANSRSRTGFSITPAGYKVKSMESAWQVNFQLKGIGRSTMKWKPGKQYAIVHDNNQLLYKYDEVQIEYINNGDGLRQNFLVNRKMPGGGALQVTIEPATELQARLLNSNSLAFFNAKNQKLLSYEDLQVWDADHTKLPAAMRYNKGVLTIEVDDSKANYPITIDPINKSPEWASSADGLLGSLSTTQIQSALYGYSVTGLGDVNGDGYGDAAITAPALIDVFSGTGSLAGVGAVFVFYGSNNGLLPTPAKTLQPNTAVAGALFGFSISSGDVTGDGINDIIVGAPLDSYTTTASALLGPTSVNVKAGKVYIYPGGNTAATNPTNFLQIKLQGTTNFSTGVAGLLLSNVNVNALFGFSVSATEDLNGDNKADVLVGAPAYLGVGLSAVQNGAAFVYYSNALNTSTPVQLQTPPMSVLGLVTLPTLLHSGLLFGYSVDAVGDFNNDGHNDVVVGAPAGVDLSSLGGVLTGQVLGGTANVYYGTGTGITPTVGTTLKSSSGSLLSNTANLFGFEVEGLRNANGTHTGAIAVGAPLGGLLPSALGLTIHSGNVHIFKKRTTAPASSITSDQVLESPRSTSLLQVLNTLDVNAMFGASIDNAYDVNCDGTADLVIGEPLSSGATLGQLQANAVGGAAYVYLGNAATGTYNATPIYDASVHFGSDFLSVNAVSLFGYSVAGVPNTRGPGTAPRIMAGSPSAALDFDNSVLNLGNTIGTLFDFLAIDNGPGKSFQFHPNLCNNNPLPVTLLHFKGQERNTVINLYWKTAEEMNLNRYEVQRSRDGVRFESVGMVFPWEDRSHVDYTYNDKNALPGNNYYRLRMIDNDGKFTYSSILLFKLELNPGVNITISPNPVVDKIAIQMTGLSENTYRMELRNVMGQKFMEKSFNITGFSQTEYLMRSASMTPGIYFITIFEKNNKKVASNRVIVL